jgi:hypothetical protein
MVSAAESLSSPHVSLGLIPKRSMLTGCGSVTTIELVPPTFVVDQPVPALWSSAALGPQPMLPKVESPVAVAPPETEDQLRRSDTSAAAVWPTATVTGRTSRS